MSGSVFTGEGDYGLAEIVKSRPSHAEKLQHNLRDTDLRECMIAGVSPWRALMQSLQLDNAETYTVLLRDEPVMMFGVVPQHELVARIWMLCSPAVERHPKTFVKLSPSIVEYFQEKYFLLENVCPVDHHKTLSWLEYLGFGFLPTAISSNGYHVLRFVRCQNLYYMQSLEDTRPVIS
jgi:hypothetical protein